MESIYISGYMCHQSRWLKWMRKYEEFTMGDIAPRYVTIRDIALCLLIVFFYGLKEKTVFNTHVLFLNLFYHYHVSSLVKYCITHTYIHTYTSISCYCSVIMSCLTLCDLTDCSMPGFPVLHYLREFAQTHVHWVCDAIQPSHPLLPASPVLSLS